MLISIEIPLQINYIADKFIRMNSKFCITVICLFIFFQLGNSQEDVTLLDLPEHQSCRDILDQGESGFVITGLNNSVGSSYTQLMFFDNFLNLNNSIAVSPDDDELSFWGMETIQSNSNNYFVFGHQYDLWSDPVEFAVIQLDANGDKIWEISLPNLEEYSTKHLIVDETIYVFGIPKLNYPYEGEFLVAYTLNINDLSTAFHSFPDLGLYRDVSFLEYANNMLYVSARKSDEAEGFVSSITELNLSLEVTWHEENNQLASSYSNYTSLLFEEDGGFVATGFARNPDNGLVNQTIVRYNQNKEVEWEQNHFSDGNMKPNNIFPNPSGGFFICGYQYEFDGSDEEYTYIQKIDETGNVLDTQFYQPIDGSKHNSIGDAMQLEDGNILAVGVTRLDNFSSADIYFISTDEFSTPSGVSDLANNTISVYPNPIQSYFYLSLGGEVQGTLQVELFDAGGKILQSETLNAISGQDLRVEITSPISNAVYYGIVTTEDRLRKTFTFSRK